MQLRWWQLPKGFETIPSKSRGVEWDAMGLGGKTGGAQAHLPVPATRPRPDPEPPALKGVTRSSLRCLPLVWCAGVGRWLPGC